MIRDSIKRLTKTYPPPSLIALRQIRENDTLTREEKIALTRMIRQQEGMVYSQKPKQRTAARVNWLLRITEGALGNISNARYGLSRAWRDDPADSLGDLIETEQIRHDIEAVTTALRNLKETLKKHNAGRSNRRAR